MTSPNLFLYNLGELPISHNCHTSRYKITTYTHFFISNTFISNASVKLAKKIKQMLSSNLMLNFCYLKFIHILHPHYHPKILEHILKNKQKNMYVCLHEIIRLIIIKMRLKMKNRSHRCNINRLRSWHGHKYSNCKKCFSMIMLL